MRALSTSDRRRVAGRPPASAAGRSVWAILLALVSLLPACTREPEGPQLESETFVDVMVALRRAHAETSTPAEYEARRAEILREAGVTDSLLVQWVRANALDVARVAALWDTINQRLTAVEDSLR